MLCAAIVEWDDRRGMNPDGLSYLEMASSGKLVSAYWSPGFPALIRVALLVFHPGPTQEFPLVHLVNFFIFGLALLAFTFFLRNWLATVELDDATKKYLLPFAFGTFVWFIVDLGACYVSTPDLCVNTVIFLVGAITCRLAVPSAKTRHYLALGATAALGYYMKAVMLPLGVVFLVLLFVSPPRGIIRKKLLYSVVTFLVIVTPLVTTMSIRLGRPSFGEVGRLNYAWYVNGLKRTGWTGDSEPIHGTPKHPPRILATKPLTLEFSSPVGGSYPPWSDPSYWYDGFKVQFNLRQQLATLKVGLRNYTNILTQMAPYLAGAIVLLVLGLNEERLPHAVRSHFWWQLAWPLGACLLYAPVHVDSRFLSGFLVLFWLGGYALLILRLNNRNIAPVLATVVCAVLISSFGMLTWAGGRIALDFIHPRQPSDTEIVAARLRDLGLRSGDGLALVGSAFAPDTYPLYARIDRLSIVAQFMDANEFWAATGPKLESVEERLCAFNVRAIVAMDRPSSLPLTGWQDITVSRGIRFSVLILPASQCSSALLHHHIDDGSSARILSEYTSPRCRSF